MKEVLTMTETDLAAALRHCIDDCGCSWPTACQTCTGAHDQIRPRGRICP